MLLELLRQLRILQEKYTYCFYTLYLRSGLRIRSSDEGKEFCIFRLDSTGLPQKKVTLAVFGCHHHMTGQLQNYLVSGVGNWVFGKSED